MTGPCPNNLREKIVSVLGKLIDNALKHLDNTGVILRFNVDDDLLARLIRVKPRPASLEVQTNVERSFSKQAPLTVWLALVRQFSEAGAPR